MFHNIFKDISGFYIQPYLNGFKLVHEKIFENADSFSFIDNALTPVLSLENSAYSFYIVNNIINNIITFLKKNNQVKSDIIEEVSI